MKIVALVLLLLIMGGTASAPASTPPLSADDRRRLDGGEIVLLNTLPPGGSERPSQGGTALAVVRAPAGAVWRVLVDYQGHTGLYPHVVDARVLEADASRTLVRYVIGVGPFSFGFHVNNYADQRHQRLWWRLAQDRRNDLFRDSWGYWQLDPDPRGVVLTYAMAARTVLPAFLTRGAERDGLADTIRAVRERAEQTS